MKTRQELIEEISKDLIRLYEGFIDKISYDCVSYGIVKQALNIIGYYDEDDYDTNGWEVDYWSTFKNAFNKIDFLYVSGSMYHGNVTISRFNNA